MTNFSYKHGIEVSTWGGTQVQACGLLICFHVNLFIEKISRKLLEEEVEINLFLNEKSIYLLINQKHTSLLKM